MNKFIIILLTYLPISLWGQNNFISVNGEFNVLSNSLDRGFINDILYGGFISDKQKEKWMSKLKKENIIYIEMNNWLEYTHINKNKQITLTLADTVTAALTSGRYVYDVLITDSSGDKTRILEGQATVTPSVSRT